MSRRVFEIGLFALVIAGSIIIAGYAQGTPPAAVASDGTLKLGPEMWLALLGGAVTIGINLQQLRSLRADMKAHITKFDQLVDVTLPDQYVRRDYWKEKIDSIEQTLRQLSRRRD